MGGHRGTLLGASAHGGTSNLYLKRTIPAGPAAWAEAEEARKELVRQVEQGRQSRTNATVGQLVDEHLKQADLGKRSKESLQGYARKHIHAGVSPGFPGRGSGDVRADSMGPPRRSVDPRP